MATPYPRTPPAPPLTFWDGLRTRSSLRGSQRRFRFIRRAMLAFAAALSAFTLLVVVHSSLEERADRLRDSRDHALHVARALDHHLARLIDSSSQYLLDLRGHIEREGGVEAIAAERLEFLVRSQRLHDEATRNAFVSDARGRKRAAATPGPATGATIQDREYFLRHLQADDRGIAISTPLQARSDSGWAMPISVRLQRRDGSFGGIAAVTVDVQALLAYFASLGAGEGTSIALVTSEGRFLVRQPDFLTAVGRRIAPRSPAYSGVEGHLTSVSPFDGSVRLVSFRRIGDYPLYAVVTRARDDVLQGWLRNTILRALAGTAIIAALVAFVAVLLTVLDRERAATLGLDHFRRVIDRSADLVYFVDAHGRVMYLNDTAKRRLAAGRQFVPRDLTVGEISRRYTPQVWQQLWSELAASREVSFECEHSTLAGDAYPVKVSASRFDVDDAGYALLIARAG